MEFIKKTKYRGEEALWFQTKTPIELENFNPRVPIYFPLYRDKKNRIYMEKMGIQRQNGKFVRLGANLWEYLKVLYFALKNEDVLDTLKKEWGFTPELKNNYVLHCGRIESHVSIRWIRSSKKGYVIGYYATNKYGNPVRTSSYIRNIFDNNVADIDLVFVETIKEYIEKQPHKMRYLLG